MFDTWLRTVFWLMCSLVAMEEFGLPCASRARISCSRSVS
jgi:hypothetical protein